MFRILNHSFFRRSPASILVLLLSLLVNQTQAAVRFDVFLGYDGIVPEGSWFPVSCEIFNDGPTFTAEVEVAAGSFAEGQSRSITVELPTGTLKRLVIPVFAASRYTHEWNARLRDERQRVRAESLGLRARKHSLWQIPLLGAITRFAPVLPDLKENLRDLQPVVARLRPSIFPDNAIALEGLHTLYLSSEEALGNNLNVNQVNAILAWLYNGGHLVIGIEQILHVNGTPWLQKLLPFTYTGMTLLPEHPQLQEWLIKDEDYTGKPFRVERSGTVSSSPYATLVADPIFERGPLQVATGSLKEGVVLAGSAQQPFMVIAQRGRGQVTVLNFSPELEPFRSWVNRTYFWAKLSGLGPELLTATSLDRYSGYSIDGVFGKMVDSKQVRKLPVAWLLLLLVVYLVVIGPLDQYWLKKIDRQMLTWVTFPVYVALFSGLIYLIGYRLRAGETEWNELHVVDIIPLPAGEQADVRGRTYASIYSPINAVYDVASEEAVATFRGEFIGNYRRGQESSHAEVHQHGNTFRARISVPVWTSQLYVNDWRRQEPVALSFTAKPTADGGYEVEVDNRLPHLLTDVRLVVGQKVLELGKIPGEKKTRLVLPRPTRTLEDFVQFYGHMFFEAVNYRQQAFGGNLQGNIENLPGSTTAASFVSQLDSEGSHRNLITPPGLDLTPLLRRDDAILLAWGPGFPASKPMNRFTARRAQQNTLFRITQPLTPRDGPKVNRL